MARDAPTGSNPTIDRPDRGPGRLAILFGTLYFIQGVGEPTEGLIIQPVRSLLGSWGHSPGQVAEFVALLAVPWSLKPLFGLLTDFMPLWGSRRKAYLVLTSALAAAGFLALGLTPMPEGDHRRLFAWLFLPTLAVAFSDVVADALMVQEGQPRGLTGMLQGVQWACMEAATVVTGLLGGYLTQSRQHRIGFLVCGALAVVMLLFSLFEVREPRAVGPVRGGPRDGLRGLGQVVRSRAMWGVGAFLFLWSFNPFSNVVLHLHMTRSMGLGEQFYGHTVALQAVASVAASLAYTAYCRLVPMARLVHASIGLGIASTLAYWALSGRPSAVAISLVVGFATMTATLIQLDLAARSCPPRVAGTGFATLMALSNLAMASSTWLGGRWYERGCRLWGDRTAFHVLVAIGAAFTAGCWLVVPLLPSGKDLPGQESTGEDFA